MSTHAPLLRLDTLSFSATTTSPHPPLQPPHNNMACMCWMPVENFKQLTVSPLRPGCCPSTAACIKTHKKPAPFLHVFSPSYPATPPGLPPRVSAGYHSNPSRSLSLSVDLHTDVSAIKARLLLSRVASRGSYSLFLRHFFFLASGSAIPQWFGSRGPPRDSHRLLHVSPPPPLPPLCLDTFCVCLQAA